MPSHASNHNSSSENDTESLLSHRTSSDSSRPQITVASPVRSAPRVRFALDEDATFVEMEDARSWAEEEDYMNSDDDDDDDDGRRGSGPGGMRVPLLTDITAPSVSLANEIDTSELLEHARPKSGMRMAFMNMANSIIGAGIIGQPYAFRQAGMGMGIFLLVSLTIIVDWTINLIVVNSKLSGANSFQATMSACFGKSGLVAISVAQWAFAFGGMIAFCIIIGDTIPHVVAALFPKIVNIPVLRILVDRRAVIVIFTLGVSYPLTLYRDIAKLAKASAFALASMVIIVVTVVTQGFRVPDEDRGDPNTNLFAINDGIFQAIGVISFAFVCHHNSLLIYGSLKTPTLDRFAAVTHYSTGISMVMCIVMAAAGYTIFRNETAGNVLNNFPADNFMVNVARFCFGLNMLTTLPLEAFVCREVMETYYFPGEAFSLPRHLIFSTALIFSAMSVALVTCDLGAVFELIGATSACALAYILPPICYIKLATRSYKTYVAGAVAVFGTAVMIISLFQSFVKMAHGGGETAKCA